MSSEPSQWALKQARSLRDAAITIPHTGDDELLRQYATALDAARRDGAKAMQEATAAWAEGRASSDGHGGTPPMVGVVTVPIFSTRMQIAGAIRALSPAAIVAAKETAK